MAVILRERTGGRWGPPISVADHEFLVGSGPSCHLRLGYPGIAHSHCRIVKDGGRVLIENLDSPAGTELNDSLIFQKSEVRDGDVLRVGPAQFQFQIATPGDPAGPQSGNSVADRTEAGPERAEPPRPEPDRPPDPPAAAPVPPKLLVSERGAISMVRVLDQKLVTDQEIGDFSGHLGHLIESGRHRIALDLGNVRQMSSQVVSRLILANRRCREAGGTLKLCKIQPQVAAAFAITGTNNHLEFYLDENDALASEWPEAPPAESRPKATGTRPERSPAPRPTSGQSRHTAPPPDVVPPAPLPTGEDAALPETMVDYLISELLLVPPECATTSFAQKARPPEQGAPAARMAVAPPATARMQKYVRLRVLNGKAKGQFVLVREQKFLIGRDPSCQLRAHSHSISKIHACIEQRDGKVFVRDLGSTNGTIVNDRKLQGEEVVVHDGDRLGMGPLQFSFSIPPGTIAFESARAPVPEPSAREPGWDPDSIPVDPDLELSIAVEAESPTVAGTEPPGPTTVPELSAESVESGSNATAPGAVEVNPYADLQFTHAFQAGLDVRLVTPAEYPMGPMGPTWGAPRPFAPPGWNSTEQLLQLLLLASGRGWSSPAPVVAPPPPAPRPAPTASPSKPPTARVAPPPAPTVSPPPVAAPDIPVSPPIRTAAATGPVMPSPGAPPSDETPWTPSAHDLLIEALLKHAPERHEPPPPPPEVVEAHDKALNSGFLENLLADLSDGPEGESTSEVEEPSDEALSFKVADPTSQGPQRTREHLKLDFECPKCGASGVALINQLGHQFLCKVCGTKFFLDPTGTVSFAEQARKAQDPARLRSRKKATDRRLDRLDRVFNAWKDIPQWAKHRAAAAVVFLLIGAWAANALILSNPLQAESLRVVEAVVNTDEGRMKAISTPKSSDATIQWLHLVNPIVKEKLKSGARTRIVVGAQDARSQLTTVIVYFESPTTQTAEVLSNDDSEDERPAVPQDAAQPRKDETAQTASKMKVLVLVWTKDRVGTYLLEGNKTFEDASKRLMPPPPPPPSLDLPTTPRTPAPAKNTPYYG